jgi:hypothetical protein
MREHLGSEKGKRRYMGMDVGRFKSRPERHDFAMSCLVEAIERAPERAESQKGRGWFRRSPLVTVVVLIISYSRLMYGSNSRE